MIFNTIEDALAVISPWAQNEGFTVCLGRSRPERGSSTNGFLAPVCCFSGWPRKTSYHLFIMSIGLIECTKGRNCIPNKHDDPQKRRDRLSGKTNCGGPSSYERTSSPTVPGWYTKSSQR